MYLFVLIYKGVFYGDTNFYFSKEAPPPPVNYLEDNFFETFDVLNSKFEWVVF